ISSSSYASTQANSDCQKRPKVRHQESDSAGDDVGLYFGHRAYPGARAEIHVFTQLTFNDVRAWLDVFNHLPPALPKKTPPSSNFVALHPRILCAGKAGAMWGHPVEGSSGASFKPAGVGGGPWHELEVIVTPENLRATWDRRSVGNLPN